MRLLIYFTLTSFVLAAPIENSFSEGALSPLLKYRIDLERRHSGVETLENMLVKPQGMAMRRPGTKLMNPSALRYHVNFNRDITWQYICENASVKAIPFVSPNEVLTLVSGRRPRLVYDSATPFQDLIGIPLYLHPFKAGQYIFISSNGGATDFAGGWLIQPETTENEIVIKDWWQLYDDSPDDFTGDETVHRYVTHSGSTGRMDMTPDGVLFVANASEIARISEDFLDVNTAFCIPDGGWPGGSTPFITGLGLTDDGKYLYVLRVDPGIWLFKFDTSDGSEVWRSDTGENSWYGGPGKTCTEIFLSSHAGQTYDIAVDSSDSVYLIASSSFVYATCLGVPGNYGASNANVSKYLSDGTFVDFYLDEGVPPDPSLSPFADGGPYGVHVDNDMGLVIGGGGNWWDSSYPEFYTGNNLWVRTLSNSSGVAIQLGEAPRLITGTIYETDNWSHGGITTLGGFIFVADPFNDTIYKLDTGLNVLDSVTLTHLVGIFPDAYGNLVVIRSNISAFTQLVLDCLWYYDTDLNFLGKSWFGNSIPRGTLQVWGGTGADGDWLFNSQTKPLPTTTTEAYDIPVPFSDSSSPIRLIPFKFSDRDAYILGFGSGFMQVYGRFFDFYEDFEIDRLLYGGWITSGNVGLYTGTGDSNYVAKIGGGGSLTKIVMPAGEQLYLSYKRGSRTTGGWIEYSIDGSNWTSIEQAPNKYLTIPEAGFVFPSYVSNYPLLYIRFRQSEPDVWYRYLLIDDVFVTATTPDFKVSNPDPADGAENVEVVFWGFFGEADENIFADSYNTYFGPTDPPPFVANASYPEISLYDILNFDTVYYWRIDTVAGGIVTTGDLWSFTTESPPP